MNVSLTPELEGLRQLRLQEARPKVAEGLEAIKAGDVHPGDEVFDELIGSAGGLDARRALRVPSFPLSGDASTCQRLVLCSESVMMPGSEQQIAPVNVDDDAWRRFQILAIESNRSTAPQKRLTSYSQAVPVTRCADRGRCP